MKPCESSKPDAVELQTAFTLLELLVVIGVLALLACLLAPALARTQPTGQTAQCLNNTRQLIFGWQMYCHDNNDKIVVNVHGGSARGAAGDPVYGMAWTEGWLDWTTSDADNTNVNFLINEKYARLARYVGGSKAVFKCPADTYLSISQRAAGWTGRVRSYSASIGVGAGNAETGPFDAIYKHYTRFSELLYPGASDTFVFLDEHPNSINDSGFFSPHQTSWPDVPATYHNGAASFSFADGHAETHKWTASLVAIRTVTPMDGVYLGSLNAPAGDADIHWMSQHTGRINSTSY